MHSWESALDWSADTLSTSSVLWPQSEAFMDRSSVMLLQFILIHLISTADGLINDKLNKNIFFENAAVSI